MSFYLTDGPVMPYAWGSRSLLADFLGRSPSGHPEAELWMGSHPGGPARLLEPVGDVTDLRELLLRKGNVLLGQDLVDRFGELPFLFKILAIQNPLSLQAHPDRDQARAGFEREESLGVPRADPERNYRDANPKPELLLALSAVEAVCGFREVSAAARVLGVAGLDAQESPLRAAVEALGSSPEPTTVEGFFRTLFALDKAQLDQVTQLVLARATDPDLDLKSEFGASFRWVSRLYGEYGSDPGLVAFLLLHHVVLEPGQALYLGPRQLHAYLSGLALELMASSDNVLRGGLTKKHVDVAELCRVLDFRPSQPQVIPLERAKAAPVGVALKEWQAPGGEFLLQCYELDGGAVSLPTPCLVLSTDGHTNLRDAERSAPLERGAQAFCGADGVTQASGRGRLYCATLPERC